MKVSQTSRENTYASVSFLIKLQGLGLQLYKKQTPKSIDKLLRYNSQNMKAFKFKI